MSSISTSGLTRSFGPVLAVDHLSLDFPASGVMGLVGPNGSGKSTLIRLLLGLVRPTEGTATVLGNPISAPAAYADKVGALIESPAFVPGLSAHRNLLSLARLRGLSASRVDEVLTMVGLAGRQTEPVKNFSLGMKQRLGIAAALLSDPQLLILDEPTNGLDPAGIVEIRGLLRSLGQDGRTVVVSSHLLTEIEAACDYIVVIRFGTLLFTGPIGDLVARTRAHIDIRAEHDADTDRLARAIIAAGWDVTNAEGTLRVVAEPTRAAGINRAAAHAGVTLSSLVVVQDSLEDIFLAMTGETDGELAAARSGQGREVA
ncbi:MAG TPA: ATP-binding cassette domain-containing protein [Actinomycetes bacterium]